MSKLLHLDLNADRLGATVMARMGQLETLYLAANAGPRPELHLQEEQRVIRDALGRGANITTITRASLDDLQRELVTRKYDLVHISAHGCEIGVHLHAGNSGIEVVEHKLLSDVLSRAAPPHGRLRCAVLSACWSSVTREFAAMVPFTVTFTGKVFDQTSIDFCRGFYAAAAETEDFAEAYEQGVLRARAGGADTFDSLLLRSNTGVIGVRSFIRDAEDLESRTEPERLLALEQHFDGRSLRASSSWTEIAHAIQRFCGRAEFRRRMRAEAFEIYLDAHSSIAVTLGHQLGYGAPVYPLQGLSRQRREPWNPDTSRQRPVHWGLQQRIVSASDGSDDLAISLSITRSIAADVSAYLSATGRQFRHVELLPLAGPGRTAIEGADHAFMFANDIANAIRSHRVGRHDARVHLFSAGPNALAFFLGQHGNALGPIQLYEFDFSNEATSSYSPSICLPLPNQPHEG